MNYGNYLDFRDIKKILVIKFRHLGDVLLTTPVFYNLKKQIKNVKVDAFVYLESLDILKDNPYIDNILTYDRKIKKLFFLKKLKKEIDLIRKVRKGKYDLVINLTEGDRGAIMAYFSKARYKVGLDPKKTGLFRKKKIYSHIAKISTKRHMVEVNLDAIRRIGIFPEKEDKNLVFNIPMEDEKSVKKLLSENNIHPFEYILIHPTTRWRFKGWDKFDLLIDRLIQEGKKIVVVSGKQDYEVGAVEKIVKNKKVLNLAGKVSIAQLAALIKMAEKFYCLDSLAFHLANSLKAKVIAFFGPTCEKTWGPWQNENAQIITSKMSCRPCHLDGCGGSKISECMRDISLSDL